MDWSKIKAEYISGGTSYRKLAKKYDVSFNTLKDIAIREHWAELKEQAHNDAATRMVSVVSKENSKIDDKYYRLVDMLLDKTEEVIVNTPIWQVTTLKEMATAMKYIKECKGIKSDIDLKEQNARIDKLIKETQEEKKDTSIHITFGDEVKKYGV